MGFPPCAWINHGARSVMREEFGAIVQPADLRVALQKLLDDDAGRRKMGEAARKFAQGDASRIARRSWRRSWRPIS